jgi:hypothetical protein
MDFENNGQSSNNFINKIKKQAKRLLKINNEKDIKITSLNQAQELLAQLNGFPNWHALEQTTSVFKNDKLSNLMLKKEEYFAKNYYVLDSDEYITSFFKIYDFSELQIQKFYGYKKIFDILNTDIQNFSIYIENKKENKKELVNTFKVDESFNISEDMIKKLFYHYNDGESVSPLYQNNMDVYFVIKTK